MEKILVSQCLYGDKVVRYDGAEKTETHPIFLKWKKEGRLIPVCPEVFGGLPTPRPDAQRIGEKVVNRYGDDVTAAYAKGAAEALRLAEEHRVAFAVMKQKSPACGSKLIYDGRFSGEKIPGEGMAVEYLRKAGFTVFGEEDLEEAEAFLRSLETEETV